MEVTLNSRTALEALAPEGYRTEQISDAETRRLLGFETRMEVHAFLKERGAFLHYSLEDAAKDREMALGVRTKPGTWQKFRSVPSVVWG
jgi:hypothetical protein